MKRSTEQIEKDLNEMDQRVKLIELNDARNKGVQKATKLWATGTAALLLAWLGITSIWHVPSLVRSTALGQAGEEVRQTIEKAKKDAKFIEDERARLSGEQSLFSTSIPANGESVICHVEPASFVKIDGYATENNYYHLFTVFVSFAYKNQDPVVSQAKFSGGHGASSDITWRADKSGAVIAKKGRYANAGVSLVVTSLKIYKGNATISVSK
jgi:hypothetical protein